MDWWVGVHPFHPEAAAAAFPELVTVASRTHSLTRSYTLAPHANMFAAAAVGSSPSLRPNNSLRRRKCRAAAAERTNERAPRRYLLKGVLPPLPIANCERAGGRAIYEGEIS